MKYTENLLLAQEVISDTNKRRKNINVVVKFDMAKHMIEYHGYF